MRRRGWLAAPAVLVGAVVGVGCGGEETTTVTEEPTVEVAAPEEFYESCVEVVKGTPVEAAGEKTCEQARDVLEQCQAQAEKVPEGAARDTAITACADAADQTIEQLAATTGG
jgi:hypothetical protein